MQTIRQFFARARQSAARLAGTTRPGHLAPLLILPLALTGPHLSVPGRVLQPPEPPAFTAIEDVAARKRAFFEFLQPIVAAENKVIRVQRERLLRLRERLASGQTLESDQREWLARLAAVYAAELPRRPTVADLDRLLLRVDIVPRSLVLVQAALESGWGRSRFARRGNNMFGQWCFAAGCGMVPARRDPGRAHELARFDSVRDAVHAYLLNLNSFHRYAGFRKLRAEQRRHGQLSGIALAPGLSAYSEQRDEYVAKVRAMIRANDLES